MIYSITARLIEAILHLWVRLSGWTTWHQRLVLDAAPVRAEIWIHGASVGELTSARSLIRVLSSEYSVLVTANSQSGREMVAGWGLPVRLAPFDLPEALTRFLEGAQPKLAVTVEGEFWPLRSKMLAERGIPQTVIGARMSTRSASRWGFMRRLIAPVLGRITALSAQDEGSETRLRHLGLPRAAILPRLDLKLLEPAQVVPPETGGERDMTILAASTHEGEDQVILDAWLAARQLRPGLRLILAPRHPQRSSQIATLIAKLGLAVHRRTEGDCGGPLLLADTLGEMPRWYARAGICFVGGSLVNVGGHTPWEPAAYGCAILYGPYVGNHAGNYSGLADVGAALQVDGHNLGAEFARLAADYSSARRMGQAARSFLEERAGDPGPLLDHLRALAKNRNAYDIRGG